MDQKARLKFYILWTAGKLEQKIPLISTLQVYLTCRVIKIKLTAEQFRFAITSPELDFMLLLSAME